MDWSQVTALTIPEGNVKQVSVNGVVLWKKYLLPRFLEYIDSNGNNFIDSGIECTSDLKIEFKGSCSDNTNQACCGGIGIQNAPIYFRYHWTPFNTSFGFWCQNSESGNASINPPYTRGEITEVTIDAPNGVAIIDGTKYTFTKLEKGLTTGKNFGVFGRMASNGVIQSKPSRFYYFKIYKNDILVRDLRPCLDPKGIVCMYDMVTKKYHYNQGTGNLIAGVPSEYTRLEYLQSNSKAYIDTGIAGGVDTLEVGCKFSWSKFVSYGAVYGNYISDSHNGIRLILHNADNIILANSNTICTTTGNTEINCARNAIHTVVNKYDTINVDGKVITRTNKVKGTANSGNIALFNRSMTNPNTARDIGVKIYSFYIKNNDELVCYLVPCRRNSDNVLGMYDVVRNIFLTNVGTSNFIAEGTV